MYKRFLNKFASLLQRLHFWAAVRSFSIYQPIYQRGKLRIGDRSSLDRWEMIKKQIVDRQAQSVLDLGCAEGFYVIQAAKECGCFALGVEANIRRLNVAQNQLVFEKTMPAGFLLGVVDEQLLEKLPRFDLVIFMSVMHHMMSTKGQKYCQQILEKLRPKIGEAMIFEMGQSDENAHQWAKQLPDMGTNPHEWIKQFLLTSGFSQVTKIGESDSYRSNRKRAIFLVEP